MTCLKKIVLENWARYRGQHTLVLDQGVHAVVASHERDEGRSNWLGKTSFMFAVRFVLYGEHLARTEDQWITEGEKFGMVAVWLDDGTLIERSRRRGKSTVLRLVEDGDKELRGDEAQARIIEIVGLNAEDFASTCFFAQKQMARFITAQPADRMKIVSAWLDLDKVRSCADDVSKRLGELLDRDDNIARRLEVLAEMMKEVRRRQGNLDNVLDDAQEEESLTTFLACVKEDAETAKTDADRAQAALEDLVAWRTHAAKAARYGEICAQGVALKAKAGGLDVAALEAGVGHQAGERTKAEQSLKEARLKHAEAKRLAAGEFDGICPVMLQACPAKKKVVEVVTSNRALVQAAADAVTKAQRAEGECSGNHAAAQAKAEEARRLIAQLDGLRGQATELLPSVEVIEERGEPPSEDEARRAADVAWAKSNAATMRYEEAKRHAADLRLHKAESARLNETRANLALDIATHREALVIFGRNGAQRQIAEGALAEIEAGANALLAESGIDLTIEVRWSREAAGKGELAPTCIECGEPFPRGRAVKECLRCGAKRTPKTVDKLDLQLSDRSGAADDLAGIGFQLSAAAWLRWERATRWSVAFIDEPFGSLDASNRRALAGKLGTMLGSRFGFNQAFVVAHDEGIMDALPQRVEIIASDEGSRFKT